MNIAIYGKNFGDEFISSIELLLRQMQKDGFQLKIYAKFAPWLKERIPLMQDVETFTHINEMLPCKALISIGGDGTLLDSVTIVQNSGVPILGINTGRLGFLSNISSSQIIDAVDALKADRYVLDHRALIEVKAEGVDFGSFNYALNEVTIHKKETSSMIAIHANMEEHYINTYWADGLIISTPTGSTAYSLSCGGPIVMPGTESWIFTPIAPHNLNVRPLVVPNTKAIQLRAEGRELQFLLTLDSRSFTIDHETEVEIKNAPFEIALINLEHQYFFNTIRKKMMWGMDKRN